MYLKEGWAAFVQDNDLRVGDFLVFSYYREYVVLSVKVFDTTWCKTLYLEGGSSANDPQ